MLVKIGNEDAGVTSLVDVTLRVTTIDLSVSSFFIESVKSLSVDVNVVIFVVLSVLDLPILAIICGFLSLISRAV